MIGRIRVHASLGAHIRAQVNSLTLDRIFDREARVSDGVLVFDVF